MFGIIAERLMEAQSILVFGIIAERLMEAQSILLHYVYVELLSICYICTYLKNRHKMSGYTINRL